MYKNSLLHSLRRFVWNIDIWIESNFLASWDECPGANVIALVSVSVSLLDAWTKTLTLAITFLPEEMGLSYCTCVLQDLSHGAIIFDLVTLTLKFDILLKNFNLGHNFLTRRDEAFILHIVTRPFTWYHNFDPVTLILKFDLLLKNLNLCCYLVMVATWRALLSSDNSYFVIHCLLKDKGSLCRFFYTCFMDYEICNGSSVFYHMMQKNFLSRFQSLSISVCCLYSYV